MDRKEFLKKGLFGIGATTLAPVVLSSFMKSEDEEVLTCTQSPVETNGPYPIINPSSYIRSNIMGDRTGVLMTLTLTIQNLSCDLVSGAYVDVWMCDKDGNYSQYGSFTSSNWLRGRQQTDANGVVSFTAIFPGWYPGRAPHIHVEILTPSGSSRLVTQLAFPVDVYTTVYASTGYHGAPDTSNTQDNIFANSLSGNMVDSATGSVSAGYTILKTITANIASNLGIAETNTNKDALKLINYPNPFSDKTIFSFVLASASDVEISIFDASGRLVDRISKKGLSAGKQEIEYSGNKLSTGNYFYKLRADGSSGSLVDSKIFIKK